MAREVYFSEKVTQESIAKLRDKIDSLYRENNSEEIVLYLSSEGGSRIAAISFFEWVRIKNIALTTVAVADVSSAAIILLLAAKKRKATSATSFLIHPGGSYRYDLKRLFGRIFPLRRFREDQVFDEYCDKVGIEILKKNTDIPEDLARKITKSSFLFMDSQKAKKAGLIHEII